MYISDKSYKASAKEYLLYENPMNGHRLIHEYIQADINDYNMDEYNAITENKNEYKDENLKHNEYIDKKIEECERTGILSITSNGITDKYLKKIVNRIKDFDNLTSISFNYTRISDFSALKKLKKLPNLKKINLA
jgi:hypothetical protein